MDNNYHSRILEYIEGQKVAFPQKILGSIHSYLINDTDGILRDGVVRIHDSERGYIEHEASFELFDNRKDARHVIDISGRVNDGGIVYPYFMVFSSKLNLWVICYERFKKYNFSNIPLYEDHANIYLSVTWKQIIRDILSTLQNLQREGVSHGGLWREDNYVEVQGRCKLLNPMREYSAENMAVDFKHLAQSLEIHLNPHGEWDSFNRALLAGTLRVRDLLQHPLIADVNTRIQIVYAINEFCRNVDQSISASVLGTIDGYSEFFDWKRRIPTERGFQEIFWLVDADGNQVWYDDYPSGLIHYMRNLFEHGKISSLSYAETVMSRCFPNYLGTFFTLVKLEDHVSQFMRGQ